MSIVESINKQLETIQVAGHNDAYVGIKYKIINCVQDIKAVRGRELIKILKCMKLKYCVRKDIFHSCFNDNLLNHKNISVISKMDILYKRHPLYVLSYKESSSMYSLF
jgi:hypothetical protein